MNRYLKFLFCITFPLSIGGISGYATATSITNWYLTIQKPSFNPPNYLFGPVWTTLYVLMGISFYIILQSPITYYRKKAIIIFIIQLILNFLWSFIFFKFQLIGLAFIEIILMWTSIFLMISIFYKVNKAAAALQIPYLLWVSFASILNGSIWLLN